MCLLPSCLWLGRSHVWRQTFPKLDFFQFLSAFPSQTFQDLLGLSLFGGPALPGIHPGCRKRGADGQLVDQGKALDPGKARTRVSPCVFRGSSANFPCIFTIVFIFPEDISHVFFRIFPCFIPFDKQRWQWNIPPFGSDFPMIFP